MNLNLNVKQSSASVGQSEEFDSPPKTPVGTKTPKGLGDAKPRRLNSVAFVALKGDLTKKNSSKLLNQSIATPQKDNDHNQSIKSTQSSPQNKKTRKSLSKRDIMLSQNITLPPESDAQFRIEQEIRDDVGQERYNKINEHIAKLHTEKVENKHQRELIMKKRRA